MTQTCVPHHLFKHRYYLNVNMITYMIILFFRLLNIRRADRLLFQESFVGGKVELSLILREKNKAASQSNNLYRYPNNTIALDNKMVNNKIKH